MPATKVLAVAAMLLPFVSQASVTLKYYIGDWNCSGDPQVTTHPENSCLTDLSVPTQYQCDPDGLGLHKTTYLDSGCTQVDRAWSRTTGVCVSGEILYCNGGNRTHVPQAPVPTSPALPFYPPVDHYCAAGTDIPQLDGCQSLEAAKQRCSWYSSSDGKTNCKAIWYIDDSCGASLPGEWTAQGHGCCWNPGDADRPYPLFDSSVPSGEEGYQRCKSICEGENWCGTFLFFPAGYCTTFPVHGACPHALKAGRNDCGSSGETATYYFKGSSQRYNVQFRSQYHLVHVPPDGPVPLDCHSSGTLNGTLGSPRDDVRVRMLAMYFSPNVAHVLSDVKNTVEATVTSAADTCKADGGCTGFVKQGQAADLQAPDVKGSVIFFSGRALTPMPRFIAFQKNPPPPWKDVPIVV